VVGHGRGGIRPDFFQLRHRLAGEADGLVKYTNPYGPPERALVEDKARQLRLEETGLVVVRWSGAEIQRNPARVIDRIVRQSRIASDLYGVLLLRPDGMAWLARCVRHSRTLSADQSAVLPLPGNWHAQLWRLAR
jgi:hypothetical protein